VSGAIRPGNAPHLFCFGLGFSAQCLAGRLIAEGWRISGTCRTEAKRQELTARGINAFLFARGHPLDDPVAALSGVTDILSSVPPDDSGDPVLDHHSTEILAMSGLRWIGYLSTTGVYGDTDGALVDETAPLQPTSERSRRRVEAEIRWLDLHRIENRPVHVFRLAGIYGPGRNALDQVRAGPVRRIDKPGHRFSRIHVDDIANVLRASLARPDAGAIYNVADDLPAAQSDVIAHACQLLDVEPPAPVPLEQVAHELSPMALSFWQDNRRIDNSRIKRDLGIQFKYPDYRAGLAACLNARPAQDRGADTWAAAGGAASDEQGGVGPTSAEAAKR
jgi:nucleoside-diphosphate-sugar epimerase